MLRETHIHLVGSQRNYDHANYEKSFVSLLEYLGGYNLPEVLIPFSVKAEVVSWVNDDETFWDLRERQNSLFLVWSLYDKKIESF